MIPVYVINNIIARGMYRKRNSSVRSAFKIGFWFDVTTRVRQSNVLSPLFEFAN